MPSLHTAKSTFQALTSSSTRNSLLAWNPPLSLSLSKLLCVFSLLQSVLFSATGAILHVVAGSVIIHNWRKLHGNYAYIYNSNTYPSKQYQDMLIAGSFFTFVDALVFAVDVFFTIKYF